jgi:anti-anti-sigma factor
MVEPLVIHTSTVGGAYTIRVAGQIDFTTAPQLAATLQRSDSTPICLDLTGVTFMDSLGIAVLIAAHRRAVERGAEFTVRNPAPILKKLFEVTNLGEMLTIETT